MVRAWNGRVGNLAASRTVHTGLALITGTEDRQHAYVALTRGTHANTAYVFTASPKAADSGPGARPALELARHDRVNTERDGNIPISGADAREQALGVLAGVLRRDGQELSATATRLRNVANADHLALLHAIWQNEVTPVREQHYRDLLNAVLPPEYRSEVTHTARWLWRTLRAAELAGLDAGDILANAVRERGLADACDVAAVIDARIRQRTGSLIPLARRPWSVQVPVIADPERRRHVTEIAALIDARTERLGEHAARHALPWATAALGPVPHDPLDRLGWQQRARAIGAYRELHGWDHPADPIGPEPAGGAPDMRAAWHAAFAALRPVDGPDVRSLPRRRAAPPARHLPGRNRMGTQVGSATNSARSAAAPRTPGSPPSAHMPTHSPPGTPAATRRPRGTRNWQPATTPWNGRTPNARPC